MKSGADAKRHCNRCRRTPTRERGLNLFPLMVPTHRAIPLVPSNRGYGEEDKGGDRQGK
jgi:hypothetical protein